MPHKANPIDFENSESNLGVANGGFSHLSLKLPISRWQRDLTDSTVLRTMGVNFGHSLLALKHTSRNWEASGQRSSLERRFEPVLGELTRGKAITKESLRDFIEGLNIPKCKDLSLKLTPHTYVGTAVELARTVEHEVDRGGDRNKEEEKGSSGGGHGTTFP
ncbi:unnamed protein product [Vicia faba]|uniref:Adenylosuccinate lyase PurB C-terminal domain-containing protein n=1 Tax=Vicia faba TaxID=3906 RepID=A0AAV0Z5B1_VICFA|nr:unnamed protein product [Vicia faba]